MRRKSDPDIGYQRWLPGRSAFDDVHDVTSVQHREMRVVPDGIGEASDEVAPD
jgi:hypothetical protein